MKAFFVLLFALLAVSLAQFKKNKKQGFEGLLSGLGGGRSSGLGGLDMLSALGGKGDVTSLLASPQGIKGLATLASLSGQQPSPMQMLKLFT